MASAHDDNLEMFVKTLHWLWCKTRYCGGSTAALIVATLVVRRPGSDSFGVRLGPTAHPHSLASKTGVDLATDQGTEISVLFESGGPLFPLELAVQTKRW
jgi:hypothetical protein